jgi:hypothetical protein
MILMPEVSKKDYWFLKGFKDSEKFQEENGGKENFKGDLEFSNNIINTWSEYCPVMLSSYLKKNETPPKEFYDDYINGVELSQEKTLLHSYLELRGAKR